MLKVTFSIDEIAAAKDLAHDYNWAVLNDLIAVSIGRAAAIGAELHRGFIVEELTKSAMSETRIFVARFASWDGGELSFIFAFNCQATCRTTKRPSSPPQMTPNSIQSFWSSFKATKRPAPSIHALEGMVS